MQEKRDFGKDGACGEPTRINQTESLASEQERVDDVSNDAGRRIDYDSCEFERPGAAFVVQDTTDPYLIYGIQYKSIRFIFINHRFHFPERRTQRRFASASSSMTPPSGSLLASHLLA